MDKKRTLSRMRRRTFIRRSGGVTLGTVIGLAAISEDAHGCQCQKSGTGTGS